MFESLNGLAVGFCMSGAPSEMSPWETAFRQLKQLALVVKPIVERKQSTIGLTA